MLLFLAQVFLISCSGAMQPGGSIELEFASRVVLAVAFRDPGQNQAFLTAYLPDDIGVCAGWEREFIDAAWDVIRLSKVRAYDEALTRIDRSPITTDEWGRQVVTADDAEVPF